MNCIYFGIASGLFDVLYVGRRCRHTGVSGDHGGVYFIRQFDIEGINEADIVAARPCALEERGEEVTMEGSLRRECYPRVNLGFAEFTSAMQAAEGR